MLAIFDKSVAVCPDTFTKRPHNYVSSLENESLVNHFASLHPDSVVAEIGDSAVIAYSLQPFPDCPRYRFGVVNDTVCIYQGYMEDIHSLREKYYLSPADDELNIVIQACKILQEVGLHTPDNVVSNLNGKFSFLVYDSFSKYLIFSSATSRSFPLFWGISTETSLILTDDYDIVENACLKDFQPLPSGHVYISRGGYAGLEAIFHDYTDEEVEEEEEEIPEETEAADVTSQMDKSWEPPPPHVFKINTQGIFFPHEKMVGIGFIIRNSSGKMIMAGCKKIKGFSTDIHAHGLAAWECLTLALEVGFRNVIWEWVSCATDDSAYLRLSASQIFLLLREFNSVKFSYIPLSANRAAFGLAEFAKEVDDCIVWILQIPECISSVVEMESYGHA